MTTVWSELADLWLANARACIARGDAYNALFAMHGAIRAIAAHEWTRWRKPPWYFGWVRR